MPITVVVADDHEVVRFGLKSILKGSDIEVIGEASDGASAIDQVLALRPHVVLMDIRMAETDGFAALEAIREKAPDIPVIMLSTFDNPTYIARSIALGAFDYILKGITRHHLIAAIQRAARGEQPPVDSEIQRIRKAMAKRKGTALADVTLTNRETQVLRHVAYGLSNREIATSLDISVETVKEHVQNVLRKLQVNDRTQAAVWALRNNLVD
ncbi:MAG: response regulator transcription factor [Pirellulaceae bacterium]|nr:response regulator transcription factor [Planctomycetales bacterium]